MSPGSDEPSGFPPRDVPRWLAYPILVVVPIALIVAGIRLGDTGIGERYMLASYQHTPSENWVLLLLALCIATFMYGSWAYRNRAWRCRLRSVVVVVGYFAVLFLFGAWGLFGIGGICVSWLLGFWIRSRHLPPR